MNPIPASAEPRPGRPVASFLPRTVRRLAACLAAASGLAVLFGGATDALARKVPTPVRGNDLVQTEIDAPQETDEYEVYLFPGDSLTIRVRATGPLFGLEVNASFLRPNGGAAPATVTGQGSGLVTFIYTATDRGLHLLRVTGGSGQFSGATGNYSAEFRVKRPKLPKTTLSDPAGGAISIDVQATTGARLTIKASTRRGTLALTELRRPDGSPDASFAAALKAARNGRSAKTRKFAVSGGAGTYRLVGTYAAGAKPVVTVAVAHDEKKRNRILGTEPDFHPSLHPQPNEGVAGVEMQVVATDFTIIPARRKRPAVLPRFFFGPVEVPSGSIVHPNGILWVFPVPEGLVAGQTYDLRIENTDGQAAVYDDALTIVHPPQIFAVTGTSGGPAGGRAVRLTGTNFRDGSLVLFGPRVADPSITLDDRIDVRTPAAPAGPLPMTVPISIRDEFGQTATAVQQFTYLDVPSNSLASIDRAFLQSLGGETVTLTGADFVASSAFELDGAALPATTVSSTQAVFVAPPHADGTATLRVTDEYEQTSTLALPYRGFADATTTTVPAPLTQSTNPNQVDGWRATRLLAGDFSGDGRADVVLLRGAPASGNSSARSRVRILRTSTGGVLEDRTAAAFPAVQIDEDDDEDWRAQDGVLADLDGDGDRDLAIVTPNDVSGGNRSSLRVFRNDGSGAFTDVTSSKVPASTAYGDRNQGVALVAADVDGTNGLDLVIAHTSHFVHTVVTVITPFDDGGTPDDPSDDTAEVTQTDVYHHPALRVLLNDGSGGFARAFSWVPSVDGTEAHQFQADALVAGDVDGDSDPDLVLTRFSVTESPAGTYRRTAVLLRNGSGTFSDASSSLPAASDPEYLQGGRLVLADFDGDTDLDLLVASATVLVSPGSGTASTGPALRLFRNVAGTFSSAGSVFPAKDGADQSQTDGVAVGDLSGDGRPEIVLVSARAPNVGGRGGRILVAGASGSWTSGSLALPSPLAADDCRGADAALADLDGDGDLDLVVVRDDTDEAVRNTRVLRNPRK